MAIHPDGSVYVLDINAAVIRRLDSAGQVVQTYHKDLPGERLDLIMLDSAAKLWAWRGYELFTVADPGGEPIARSEATTQDGFPSRLGGIQRSVSVAPDRKSGVCEVAFSDGRKVVLPLLVSGKFVVGVDFLDIDDANNICTVVVTADRPDGTTYGGYLAKYDSRGQLSSLADIEPDFYAIPSRRYVLDGQGRFYQLLPSRDRVRVIRWEEKQGQ